jgi:O-acetyl-ADP-ribose deacetylase (regulator of RNase III)
MIERVSGDILQADVEALVNTVNCRGVMGKGVALAIKQAYPAVYASYRAASERDEIQPGRMHVVPTGGIANPRYVINFPTKRHWKGKSRREDVERGLTALIDELRTRGIRSVAVPALGCGNGGLDWNDVRTLIEDAFEQVPDVRALVFDPPGWRDLAGHGGPPCALSSAEAALVLILDRYLVFGYTLADLEIERLAYLLQAAGTPLALRFVDGGRGPRAADFDRFMRDLSRRLGQWAYDRSGEYTPPLPSAVVAAARTALGAARAAFERVARTIEGFETPYGLALLTSLHWHLAALDRIEPVDVSTVGGVAERIGAMAPDHARAAWQHLTGVGWPTPSMVEMHETVGAA